MPVSLRLDAGPGVGRPCPSLRGRKTKEDAMTVHVCMDAAGDVWVANAQGDRLHICFFPAADETEDMLRAMGYQRLLAAYPAAHMVGAPGMAPEDLSALFLKA
jgi:hypothetical protein